MPSSHLFGFSLIYYYITTHPSGKIETQLDIYNNEEWIAEAKTVHGFGALFLDGLGFLMYGSLWVVAGKGKCLGGVRMDVADQGQVVNGKQHSIGKEKMQHSRIRCGLCATNYSVNSSLSGLVQ